MRLFHYFFFFCALLIVNAQAQYRVIDGKIHRAGERIHLLGVNWFGFESELHIAHGLWSRDYKEMIQQMKELGFTAVRLPFGAEAVADSAIPTSAFRADLPGNQDFIGKSSLQAMDLIVAEFARQEMHVLLDYHTIAGRDHIWDVWYDENSTEQDWIDGLVKIATRYKDSPYVMGIDLKNEPHGIATWDTGPSASDWKRASEAAAAAVMAVNTNALIFVEGVGSNPTCSDNTHNTWWGGNLQPMSVNCSPPAIPAERLVLSPHVYGPDVFAQPYFNDPNFPENLPAIWETHFGFAVDEGYVLAPGEFGGKYGDGVASDIVWQDRIVDYFIEKEIFDFFYWSWNPNSGDTEGIVGEDWTTVKTAKYNNLKRLMDAANEDLMNTGGNNRPLVQVTSPSNNAQIEGPAAVDITVNATDSDGTIAEIEFILNGTLVSSDTTAPFVFTTTELAFGTYEISAKATDNEGGTRTSSPITIVVFDPNIPIPSGEQIVEYRDGSNSTSQLTMNPVLRIVNNGTEAVPLNEFTIRYWFTGDSNIGTVAACDYAFVDSSNITTTFSSLPNPVDTADTYLEVGFTTAAGSLAAAGNSGEIQLRLHRQNFVQAIYDQSNDHSYDGGVSQYTPNNRITLYRSGNLISGVEPTTPTGPDADTDDDGLPDSYEMTYGLDPFTNSAEGDLDNDGRTNLEEYISGTAPNDPNSLFKIMSISPQGTNEAQVVWTSVAGRQYTIQTSENLSTPFVSQGDALSATPPANTAMVPMTGERLFYRILVEEAP